MRRRLRGEEGVALVIAVLSMMLMGALGSALVLTTMTEASVASNYADGVEAFYVADAAVERTLSDLPEVADWTSLFGVRFDGPSDVLMPGAAGRSQVRVVVTVADAGVAGAILVRGQALGRRDVQRTVEATVVHTGQTGPAAVRLLAWREVR